jgi:hypothetical protein
MISDGARELRGLEQARDAAVRCAWFVELSRWRGSLAEVARTFRIHTSLVVAGFFAGKLPSLKGILAGCEIQLPFYPQIPTTRRAQRLSAGDQKGVRSSSAKAAADRSLRLRHRATALSQSSVGTDRYPHTPGHSSQLPAASHVRATGWSAAFSRRAHRKANNSDTSQMRQTSAERV